jgi:hypothetical protein
VTNHERLRQAHIEQRALTVIHEFDSVADAQALLTSPDIEAAIGPRSPAVRRRAGGAVVA